MERAWNLAPVTVDGGLPQSTPPAPTPAVSAPIVSRTAGGGGGLLARAGLLSSSGFVPSDAPMPAAPGRRQLYDELAVSKWRAYDSTVRTAYSAALAALATTKGLKKPAVARARDLRARVEREEQTRQHAMSELLLQFAGNGPGGAGAVSAEAYSDLCARLVRNNLPHAGPLSPSKSMGKAVSEYLSAVDHHGQMTGLCTVLAD